MLVPQRWDLTLYPGFQFDPLLLFYEDQAKTVPFPLAGYTAQLTLGNGLLVLTDTSGLTLGLGAVQVFAAAALTEDIAPGLLAWQLAWTAPGGQPDCPAAGRLLVKVPSSQGAP